MTYSENELRNSFLPAKCPCCGKDIMIPKGLTDVFCSRCGSKFLADAALQYAAASSLRGNLREPTMLVTTERTKLSQPLPRMMTIKQVAKTGMIPEHTLRSLVKQNRIPYVHVGNRALINSEKLLEFLNSGTIESDDQV